MPIIRNGKESDRKPSRSLTPDQVREIRRRAVREPYPRLAKIFGLSASAIGLIYRRETYRDVDPPKGGVSPQEVEALFAFDATEARSSGRSTAASEWAQEAISSGTPILMVEPPKSAVNEGDVVQLRTGEGPKMIVTHVDQGRGLVHVTWWDRGTVCGSHAPLASVKKVA